MGYQVSASNSAGTISSRGIIQSAEEALKLAEDHINEGMKNVTLIDVESGVTLGGDQLKARLAMIRRNERNA